MHRSVLPCLGLALLLGGCLFLGSPSSPPQASPDAPPSREALAADIERRKVAAPGLDQLGFKVFSALLAENPTENLALSPTSLGRALLMAYTGARGSTREAMASALGMPDQSEATLDNWAAATGPSLDKRGVAIQVLDSAWLRADFPIRPAFKVELSRLFSAEVGSFSDSADGTAKLRGWIQRASNKLLDGQGFEIKDKDKLALADVISLDGRWDEIFPKSQTQSRPFFSRPAESHEVPMMQRSGEFQYTEDEGYQVVRLPNQESAYAMYILLASDSATVPAPLDADRFERLVNKVTKNRGQLLLPRFSVNQNNPLSEPLKAEGLALAFSDDADFSGISPLLRIDDVSQEVRIQVDEEGTVAAAATVVKTVPGVILFEHPFSMEVNRPFYFAIREDATKAVLFMGKVFQPE